MKKIFQEIFSFSSSNSSQPSASNSSPSASVHAPLPSSLQPIYSYSFSLIQKGPSCAGPQMNVAGHSLWR